MTAKVKVNGVEIELTPEQEAIAYPVAKEKLRISKPFDDKWIDCSIEMPSFYEGNSISNHVWAKGIDGKIMEDVGLFCGVRNVVCFGATQAHYHPNITHWQPLYLKP